MKLAQDVTDIGHEILQRRLSCQLTQKEAADIVGVHSATLRRWEKGKLVPNAVVYLQFLAETDKLLKQKQPERSGRDAPRVRGCRKSSLGNR